MSDVAVSKSAKSRIQPHEVSAKPVFEIPEFKIPNIEMPAAIRELAQRGGAQAKDNYEKMKAAREEMAAVVEATFTIASNGATQYGLKVIQAARANSTAALDFVSKLMSVNSPSEGVELSTAHMRQQFDAASRQSRELAALAQKIATDAVEPIKTGMSKVFERKA